MKLFNIGHKPIPSALLFLLFISGCTHNYSPPEETFTGYVTQEKIRMKVGLNITDELRQAKWEKSKMGDTYIMLVGESLVRNSEALTRRVFSDVVVVNGKLQDQTAGVDAILTPKLMYINHIVGAAGWADSIVAIKLEWDLIAQNGKPVWIETICGEATGPRRTGNPERILKPALEQLLLNSQHALDSAEVIKHFASDR